MNEVQKFLKQIIRFDNFPKLISPLLRVSFIPFVKKI
jgi:hypothetical protein